jgi:hypothetical protein
MSFSSDLSPLRITSNRFYRIAPLPCKVYGNDPFPTRGGRGGQGGRQGGRVGRGSATGQSVVSRSTVARPGTPFVTFSDICVVLVA